MAYSIGQFRRSQLDSYTTDLSFTQSLLVDENDIINFYNPCLYLSGSNVVSSLYSYYLKFEVTQSETWAQDFTVTLINGELTEDNTQEVKILSVPKGVGTTTFELIFHPNSTYNEIVFDLSRIVADFYQENDDGTEGRVMNVTVDAFAIVDNLVTTLSTLYDDLTELKKIGIQGPPGMMFVVDGEEMRIGRTGIYELYNDDITISYLGFVVKDSTFTQDGKDFFILDFKY